MNACDISFEHVNDRFFIIHQTLNPTLHVITIKELTLNIVFIHNLVEITQVLSGE
jgi:hypothetical protein